LSGIRKMKIKIAIYHPGLNIFGGGETVALTIASCLSKKYEIDMLTPQDIDKIKLENFFKIRLNNVKIKKLNFHSMVNKIPSFNSIKRDISLRFLGPLNKYDIIIDTSTNGWFTKEIKPKTICYIHFPYFQPKKKGIKSILNLALIDAQHSFHYNRIICNSKFTAEDVKRYTSKPIEIIYPPVKSNEIIGLSRKTKKKNIIVTIGRFTHEKKHEIMIETFKKFYKANKEWEFHLIGAFRRDVSLYKEDYYKKLKEIAKGCLIFFHENMHHDKVLQFLAKSKIYWHARGYGENDLNEYENFGITTVEAMGAGCVPIVINLGAQPEIIDHGKNGFVWKEPNELIKYTKKIIDNRRLMSKLSKKAREKALKYDISIFRKKILKTVEDIINEIQRQS